MILGTAVSNARLEVGSFVVTIGAHQWEIVDGWTSFGRTVPSTPYGTQYPQPYGIKARHREVRFVKVDAQMDDLRELSYRAGRTGTPVKFTPDIADTGTFWMLDWPGVVALTHAEENRAELRIRLQEQSPGV